MPSQYDDNTATDTYCYFITLYTQGRKQLLAYCEMSDSRVVRLIPSRIGQLASKTWATLPHISTEIFSLMPNCIYAVVTVDSTSLPGGQKLVQDAVRAFKTETTRMYNLTSVQDYRSRLWAATFEVAMVDTPARLAELRAFLSERALLSRAEMLL